jgi:hypothetical protein
MSDSDGIDVFDSEPEVEPIAPALSRKCTHDSLNTSTSAAVTSVLPTATTSPAKKRPRKLKGKGKQTEESPTPVPEASSTSTLSRTVTRRIANAVHLTGIVKLTTAAAAVKAQSSIKTSKSFLFTTTLNLMTFSFCVST